MDEQKAALQLWNETSVSQHLLPFTILPLEEKDELIEIIQKLDQYQLEVWYHTIVGTYDLSYFDTEYQTTLNELGAQRAIELIQQSYDHLQKKSSGLSVEKMRVSPYGIETRIFLLHRGFTFFL